jgi:hypothetical protein
MESCISEFLDNCDANNDHKITLVEWGQCLGATDGNSIIHYSLTKFIYFFIIKCFNFDFSAEMEDKCTQFKASQE